ncbi:MAG: adenylate/guanylate cyclase domain-containing protein [Candidatus Algichlamydia australiensis]|nr:adenylate/guanylate cyclase domain-containing protein [Chlamydiales bacterium]
MKLKTRLFVWVGALFFIAFIFSYFFEGRLVRKKLRESEENISKQIVSINEKKRDTIEKYLGVILAELEAKLDSILEELLEYPLMRRGFAPTEENLRYNTWFHCSSLMLHNKWIDYVQNVNENKLTALIIGNNVKDTGIKIEALSKDHGLAVVTENGKNRGPYFAIRFYLDRFMMHETVPIELFETIEPTIPAIWFLFTPEQIQNFPLDEKIPDIPAKNLPLGPMVHWPSSEFRKTFFAGLLKSIEKSQQYIEENPTILTKSEIWNRRIAARSIRGVGKRVAYEPTAHDRKLYSDQMDSRVFRRFEELSNQLDDLVLSRDLTFAFTLGPFGFSPFNTKAPVGVARTPAGEAEGKSLLSEEIFFPKPLYGKFSERENYPPNEELCLSRSLEIIPVPAIDHFYFGNSLRLFEFKNGEKSQREGYLTTAVDGDRVMERLALSTNQVAVFVNDGKILKAFDPEGKEIKEKQWLGIDVSQIINKESGIIKIGGTDYFFLHMDPFKESKFHFYIFNLASREFQLLHALDKNANELISSISVNMRIIALISLIFVLIILNNLARRITKPITILASAAERVGAGELDEIELPKPTHKRKDEVAQLFHSFNGMIKGLQEKERVRGVLNKVVSDEIAEEILKGNVHLGGEEKIVTVLFADIRCFTKHTEKMQPADVVTMLNTCMTRISHLVDEHHGVIDKFVGDEVMALFGAPVEKEDSAYQAVASAIGMIESLRSWNQERGQQSLSPIEMGIGIHTGPVLAGNMGAENRLNYTVLGANVNLSSRLCSAAKPMEILISESTYEHSLVKEKINVESMEPIELKGFTEPIKLYRVTGFK